MADFGLGGSFLRAAFKKHFIMAKGKKQIESKYPIVIETFKDFGTYEISNIRDQNPSCFNGVVRFKKYRVIIEEIEEPKSVYGERLQKMWDECDNHHHWNPLQSAADSIGFELIGSMGNKRVKK